MSDSSAADPRPRILIPARFSSSAAALRFEAEVTARKLVEAVFAAGGEPLTAHPARADGLEAAELEARFPFADALLLPGGGDLHPQFYNGEQHEALYDVDPEQDEFDLALAGWAVSTQRPVLAICRGLQVVNVRLGGTITAHMDSPHRHVVSRLDIEPGARLAQLLDTDQLLISCYHHQSLAELGTGLRAVAYGADATVEAVELDGPGWFVGVQWHPEDTAETDVHQAAIFAGLVDAAARFRARQHMTA